jgi:hypothetical protein
MGEYEDRYPEAYGEETESQAAQRRLRGLGLPRQVRDGEPAVVEPAQDAESTPKPPRPPRQFERAPRPIVQRSPQEICDDVYVALNSNPSIDTSGISIWVDGSEVTLDGSINSLIAVSIAQSLVSNVPGVSRVQVQLRVAPPRGSQTAAG